MSKDASLSKRRPLTAGVAGLAMVVLAIGLAVVGNILAFEQVRSVTTRLMTEATARAGQVAATANEQFPQRLASALRMVAVHVRRRPNKAWEPPPRFPAWIDKLYVWNGNELRGLGTPGDENPAIASVVRNQVSAGPPEISAVAYTASPQIDFARADGEDLVIAQLGSTDVDLNPIVVVAAISQARIEADFLRPLVSADDALELAVTGTDPDRDPDNANHPDIPNSGSQNLAGALRIWAIRPAKAFVDDQRRTVLAQTLVYVGLTTVALGTLLLAMWFLTRVVRREVALAELKSGFVADVSHELKTPLALIRMFAETLRDGRVASDEKRQEYYEVILRESTRLTDLIHNILDFSRIEAGRKEYHLQTTDVAASVEQTYATYRPQLDHAGFEHELRIEAGLPSVDADRGAIAQILVNLITNAVKYSDDEKYVLIEVTSDTRRNRRGVLISVHDLGIGIAPEDRALLTEGFYRASDSRVRGKAGAGLGLAVVRHIVDAHGGSLDVESRLVKGSTFRVFLPATPEPVTSEDKTDGANTDR